MSTSSIKREDQLQVLVVNAENVVKTIYKLIELSCPYMLLDKPLNHHSTVSID